MPSNQTNCNNCGCTPNPLDSGNWESESTTGRSSATSDPNQLAPNFSPSPPGECIIGFKRKTVGTCWSEKTYDAGANLHPDTNCKKEDIVFEIPDYAWGASVDNRGIVTFGQHGADITVAVKCGGVSDTMRLIFLKINTETEAPFPEGRDRKLLGVCENVFLEVNPKLSIIQWTILGKGDLVGRDFSPHFHAADSSSHPVIYATMKTPIEITCSVQFDVIPPTGIEIVRKPNLPDYHEQDLPSCGFCGKVYILPATVCFMGIEVREEDCLGVGQGYFLPLNGESHNPGVWTSVSPGDNTHPSVMDGGDKCTVRGHWTWRLEWGTLTFSIPWRYKCPGKDTNYLFDTVEALTIVDKDGKMTVSKGGCRLTKELAAPTSGSWNVCNP